MRRQFLLQCSDKLLKASCVLKLFCARRFASLKHIFQLLTACAKKPGTIKTMFGMKTSLKQQWPKAVLHIKFPNHAAHKNRNFHFGTHTIARWSLCENSAKLKMKERVSKICIFIISEIYCSQRPCLHCVNSKAFGTNMDSF